MLVRCVARLALLALRIGHNRRAPAQGPVYTSKGSADGKLILTFNETAGGLKSLDGAPLTGFAIAGKDRKWHWAKAEIRDARRVVVSCPDVPNPVAVRYGWSDFPVVNLANSDGLPASPFRTDDWPAITNKP